jgi:nicotinamide-nucleotide amidase
MWSDAFLLKCVTKGGYTGDYRANEGMFIIAGMILWSESKNDCAMGYNTEQIGGIRNYMIGNSQTLCVAESVTAGHLQAALSLAEEASRFFQGGITVYNIGQKARHLRVNPIDALSCNSVSPTVAEEMALNALSFFSSDWSIAITGYAAPVPELGIKDLFAFYAIAFRNKVVLSEKIDSDHKGAFEVQRYFSEAVLEELNKYLMSILKK